MRMRNYILQSFPFLEDDFDALTDYQLFCKMIGYVRKMSKQFDDFQKKLDKYEEYFNNLDIQEEVDNKLDEMLENGQLDELITEFLELPVLYTYNTVSDMKLADNLVDGSRCQTLGFYNVGDGGNAFYKIRTIENDDVIDEKKLIALTDNTLLAELIIYKDLNILQVGCKSDGSTDIGSTINSFIDDYDIIIPEGNYLVTTTINITRDNTSFNCKGNLLVGDNICIMLNASDCYIDIDKITGDEDVNSVGLKLVADTSNSHSIWNNNINLGVVKKLNDGILIDTSYKGAQYNKISFNEINCEYCIHFYAHDGGWVNENTFNGGRLSGNYGVYMEKGSSIGDYYNGNKFLNVGYENITNPIVLQYAIRNTFRHSRMAESLNGTYWIQCDADTRLNNFENDSSLHFDKVNDLNSALTSRNTYKAYPLIWEGHYYNYDGFVITGRKFLSERPVEPTIPTAMGYNLDGNYESPIYYNGMLVTTGCDSNTTITLKLPSVFSNAGVTDFLLRISYRGQNGSITVVDSDNTTILSNANIGDDEYVTNRIFRVTLNYSGIIPKWIVTKIVN